MNRPRSVRWAVRVFRVFLRALPRRVRRRHGREIETLFEELATEAHARRGVAGVVWVGLQNVVDLVRGYRVDRVPGRRTEASERGRWASMSDALTQDLRLSLRNLIARPAATLLAVLSLTVGMAVTIGVFTFVDTVLWQPWSFDDPDRVVQVFELRDEYRLPSWPTFEAVEEEVDLFDGVLASQLDQFALGISDEGGAQTLTGERVSADYFRVLGVPAELGRYPMAGDRHDGVLPIVLSHYGWINYLGGASDIIGRPVRLNGHAGEIVAVAPATLDGTKWGVSAELWVPMAAWASVDGWTDWSTDRGLIVTVMARMNDGVSLEAVDAALASLADGLQGTDARFEGVTLVATDRLRGDMGPRIGMTADAIGIVAILSGVLILLLGCGNVAGLLLARSVLRRREIAVRFALGASRARVVGQLVTESLLLAVVATGLGLLLSVYGTEALTGLLPTFEFRVRFVTRPGARSLLLAAGLVMVTVVAAGLAPAVQLARTNLGAAMKGAARSGLSGGRARLLSTVVIGMVGGSVLALFLAGVFGRTASRAAAASPGFATDNRVMAVVPLRLAGYDWSEATAWFEDLERRLVAIPGARAVGYGSGIPLGESWATAEVYSGDGTYEVGEPGVTAFRSSVSDDYFAAMGTRLLRGRSFTTADGPDGPYVAVINEELARRLWPGEDPLGREIRFGLDDEASLVEVVGIAENGLYFQVGESPEPAVFASFGQWPQAQAMVVLESEGDPLQLVPAIRAELAKLDPAVPLQRIRTSESHFKQAMWLQRLAASIGATVSVLALLLSAAGLYGVMAFTLGARRHEMGVRRALGAKGSNVVGLAVRGALRLAALGLLVGGALSLLAGQAVRTAVPGVETWDTVVFATITVVVVVVAGLAGLVPGITSARVDPRTALRSE